MSVVTSVMSVVLKSMVGDKFGNGLAKELMGISINGLSEKGINEITSFINSEKSQIEHVLSRENMKSMGIPEENIGYVIAEIKDLFSWINISDEVLRQCKYDSMKLRFFLWNEYCTQKDGYIECESEINECLFAVAKVLVKLERESERIISKMLIQISNSVDDANVRLQKISEYMEDNSGKLDITYQTILEKIKMMLEQNQKLSIIKDDKSSANQVIMFRNDTKKDYVKKWDSRLFLHVNNDENPITLADAFIMPNYSICKKINRINFLDSDTLDKIIHKFIKYDITSTMLITGAPGIGKSSITSWISYEYKNNDSILVLRFRDWDGEELNKGLLHAVCSTLECKKRELNNKVLIMDGFDEIKCLDKRDYLLSVFLNDIKDYDNLKIIITSRPAYINSEGFQNSLTILGFDIIQIETFYKLIRGVELDSNAKIKKNLEVLSIPVILYMAIMSNVDVSSNPTKPELYNRIFAKVGGDI